MYFNTTIKLVLTKKSTPIQDHYIIFITYGQFLAFVDGKRFTGEKIFGYKIGTGPN